MNTKIYYIVFIIFICQSCFNKNERIKYYDLNGYIIKEEYDKYGTLKSKSTYTKDTVQSGEYSEYYPNGKYLKWLWYPRYPQLDKYPQFGCYYDSLGNFIHFSGYPFIRSTWNTSHEKIIEIANPPNLSYLMKYEDYSEIGLMRRIVYEPFKTDSTAWVTIESLKEFKEGHNYYITYLFCNNNAIPIDSVKMELLP